MKNIKKSYMICVLAPRLAWLTPPPEPMCLQRVLAAQPTQWGPAAPEPRAYISAGLLGFTTVAISRVDCWLATERA